MSSFKSTLFLCSRLQLWKDIAIVYHVGLDSVSDANMGQYVAEVSFCQSLKGTSAYKTCSVLREVPSSSGMGPVNLLLPMSTIRRVESLGSHVPSVPVRLLLRNTSRCR